MLTSDETIYSNWFEALRRPEGSPVAVCVCVIGLSRPEGAPGDDDDGGDGDGGPDEGAALPGGGPCAVFRILLQDVEGTFELETLHTSDIDVAQRAFAAMRAGTYMVACGTLHNLPGRGRTLTFMHLLSLSPLRRPSSLLGATPEELAEADRDIDRMAAEGPGALRAFLREELHQVHNVTTRGMSRRMVLCEDAVLLQALSFGQVDTSVNPRISLFFHSAPGKSKKIFSQMAETLAMTSATVQPALCTPVGLSIHLEQRQGGWKAVPGALPRANLGLCVLEDVHRQQKKDTNLFQALLMSGMEDGRVTSMKAGFASYDARCAIHMNGNRQSLLTGEFEVEGAHARAADLSLAWDQATRLDLIIAVGQGDDAETSAKAMARTQPRADTPEWQEEVLRRKRRLKVLVARLWDRFPMVDTGPVGEEIDALMDDLFVVLRRHMAGVTGAQENVVNSDSMVRRMANTVRKLIGASARLRGSGVATAADVQRAWDMLSLKLESVRWMCGQEEGMVTPGPRAEQVGRAERESQRRFGDIMADFGGMVATARQIATHLKCGVRIVQKLMELYRIEAEYGRYRVPTAVEYEAMMNKWAEEELLAQQQGPAAAPAEEDKGDEEGEGDEEREEPEAVPFDNGLGQMSLALTPVLVALRVLTYEQQEDITSAICELVVDPDPVIVDLNVWRVATAVEPYVSEAVKKLLEVTLSEKDFDKRGLAAARLYAVSDLPDRRITLRSWLRRMQLSETTAGYLKAMIAQLDHDEVEVLAAQARQAAGYAEEG